VYLPPFTPTSFYPYQLLPLPDCTTTLFNSIGIGRDTNLPPSRDTKRNPNILKRKLAKHQRANDFIPTIKRVIAIYNKQNLFCSKTSSKST